MRHWLGERFRREQFRPTWFGILINPFWLARRGLDENMRKLAPRLRGRLLDVGCGQKPYADLFEASEYIGLELDTPANRTSKKADHHYDGATFPFADSEFDGVIVNQVFEHIFTPELFLAEVRRVLKNEGLLLMTVPFVWDEHEQPFDFARYSSYGLKSVLESNGFTVLEQHKSVDDIRVVFQLINTYIFKKTVSGNSWINLIATMVFMAPVTLMGILLSRVLPENPDLYLDNCILARKSGV